MSWELAGHTFPWLFSLGASATATYVFRAVFLSSFGGEACFGAPLAVWAAFPAISDALTRPWCKSAPDCIRLN